MFIAEQLSSFVKIACGAPEECKGVKTDLPHLAQMSRGPKVAAITVNWNRPEETVDCVRSLRTGGLQGLEIVVVDNGSDPRAVETIRMSVPEARIVELGRNEGYVRGANAGLREAMKSNFTHFLLINNDAFGEPGFVARLLEGMARHSSAGIVGPKILYHDRRRIWFAGGRFNRTWGYTTHPLMDEEDRGTGEERKVDFVTGCVMLVRREVFDEVVLLD
ncbi:MAG: glycosyltransferase family 2 protein, partial [Euryarchaeota archaeon]|nr:glycosyltransferase family 2 protein [Euryarchaeota archaeon]